MSLIALDNLRQVRRALGMSQGELASMLGISIRAVQSYEQGWRNAPPYVQKLAGLLLFLERRKGHARRRPCWESRNCRQEARSECPVYAFRAGDMCWLISGDSCGAGRKKAWADKMARCARCAIMRDWLAV